MRRTPVTVDPASLPAVYHPLLSGPVYDSSCSDAAEVLFFEKEDGVYLKSAAAGALKKEAAMTKFYHSRRLGDVPLAAEVLDYRTENGRDWLLTARIPGEDCTHVDARADPAALSAMLGETLRALHELPADGCPVPRRTQEYLASVEEGYRARRFEPFYYSKDYGAITADEAYKLVRENASLLTSRVLLHGDYCLPNVMQRGGRFAGFIDLDHGGVGERHIDLYWGAWSLQFNLKTDAYRQRFFDAYGRELVNEELLRVIAAAEIFG